MNATDYWPMAREYLVWNAAVAALQFWTADLKAHILGSTIDQVFSVFFYSTSTHILCPQSDKILFSHFMTTLNATFESKVALEDKSYENDIPTQGFHHVSSIKNASFNPVPVTPHSTRDP